MPMLFDYLCVCIACFLLQLLVQQQHRAHIYAVCTAPHAKKSCRGTSCKLTEATKWVCDIHCMRARVSGCSSPFGCKPEVPSSSGSGKSLFRSTSPLHNIMRPCSLCCHSNQACKVTCNLLLSMAVPCRLTLVTCNVLGSSCTACHDVVIAAITLPACLS